MIRIFVGTPANSEDLECQAAFEWSLRKHHPQDDIELTWMMVSRDPASPWYGWNMKGWATPFSPLRWGIPAACGYQGRAIYNDCDQLYMADVAELWNQPIPDGKALLMAPDGASCTMLMDCERMRKVLPSIERLKREEGYFRQVRRDIVKHSAPFKGDWNCRDGKGHSTIYDGDAKLLHYTLIPTQPNHKYARERLKREGKPHWFAGPDLPHPNPEVTKLFDDTYAEAVAAGRGPEAFRVPEEFGAYGR
jgi:hypothetical protein